MPLRLIALVAALCWSLGASAETMTSQNGSDSFFAGDTLLLTLDEKGDAFAAASTAILGGVAAESLHVAGFDLSIGTDVGGDIYAAGVKIELDSSAAGDTTAFGFSVKSTDKATTEGNARLAGNTVTIDGPVRGALTVMGRSVILNAPVDGDVRIAAGTLTFGPEALVRGMLSYSTPDVVDVPERVAMPDRVFYSELDLGEEWETFPEDWPAPEMPTFPTAMTVFGTFLVTLLFFIVLGAIALAFFPDQLERTRLSLAAAPGRAMLAGVAGLSLMIGLIPVALMTIVGIPFIPIIILALIAAWTLGYALGAYALALYVWGALAGDKAPGVYARLALLAAAVTIIALFNFIPFVGWVVNFTLVLLGIGAMARPILARIASVPPKTETAAIG